jgi:antitoxin VapB
MAVCAERDGLIVALSRLVASDADADLVARTRACAGVFARMVDATVPGASAADVYRAAAEAYASAGYPDEERLHHQGGAIAYRAREWVAHPTAAQRVTAPQAFAWNPSITGTKVEETIVVHDDGGFEVVTHDPSWPAETFHVRGLALRVPVARVIGA